MGWVYLGAAFYLAVTLWVFSAIGVAKRYDNDVKRQFRLRK